MRRESDDRERAFDERRGEADQAYWTLRKTFPDMQLDRDVARSAKAFQFCNHLRNYLSRISAFVPMQNSN